MERLSITKKLLISYLLLVVAVSVLSVLLMFPDQKKTMHRDLEGTLSRVAYILSSDRQVIEELKAGKFSESLCRRLDGIHEMTRDIIDYIVIADDNSIRLYHPDANLIGQKFSGGDEINALSGKIDAYVTTEQGHPDVQKRAFHSVTDDTGAVVGFVMASTSTRSIEAHEKEMLLRALIFMVISLVTGLFLALGIMSTIRRILLGYDPTTFARMYLQREEILDKLREGIFVVNQNQRIIYKNLPSKSYVTGEDLPEISPLYPGVRDSLKSNETTPWQPIQLEDRSFLVSMVPLRPMENLDAVMVILHNRTEFVALTEQVTGLNHVVDALRTNTHEFRNQLHVIAGLLQLDKIEEAMNLIGQEWTKSSAQNIVRLIKDTTIEALLIGKANRATELKIDFELRRDSYLPDKNKFLTSMELVKIIGNLIENSYEAIGDSAGERQVEFFINADEDGLTITVDDTGCGMTQEQIDKIFAGAFTTKGAGHGYGMRLIREVVEGHKGYLQIESELGVGTSITVNISAKNPASVGGD